MPRKFRGAKTVFIFLDARRSSLWVALVLALLGVSGALWRAHLRHEIRLAHGDNLWRVRYTVDFFCGEARR